MGEWKHGICGCFDNCGLCIFTYFCPCIVFGQTAEKVGESCAMCGFCLLVPIGDIVAFTQIRGKVREAHGIEGSCFGDFLCFVFCGLCALVQTAAEVKDGAQALSMARE